VVVVTRLQITDLHLSFGGVRALNGISLSVEEGQIVGLIGPNGAGKTSLFNCMCGVYIPDSGTILFEGRDMIGLKPYRVAEAGIARMFQNLALFDYLTTMENLLLGRHHLYQTGWWSDMMGAGRYRDEEIRHRKVVEEIIEFLNLERYRKHPVGLLPYGVLKRIELGRALCMEPKLLLLDEPAAGLNQEETEDMARYILDIKEELGITQLLIEHDLSMVLDLADAVQVLDFGQGIASGDPAAIRADPRVLEAYAGKQAMT